MKEEEKDFFERCFGIVAGLEVQNEAQAIAKEVVLDEIENLQSQLKAKEDNWNKLKQDIGYELLKLREPNEYNNGLVNGINYVLNAMQELEILSKGDNK
jgi:hypothetical protein